MMFGFEPRCFLFHSCLAWIGIRWPAETAATGVPSSRGGRGWSLDRDRRSRRWNKIISININNLNKIHGPRKARAVDRNCGARSIQARSNITRGDGSCLTVAEQLNILCIPRWSKPKEVPDVGLARALLAPVY